MRARHLCYKGGGCSLWVLRPYSMHQTWTILQQNGPNHLGLPFAGRQDRRARPGGFFRGTGAGDGRGPSCRVISKLLCHELPRDGSMRAASASPPHRVSPAPIPPSLRLFQARKATITAHGDSTFLELRREDFVRARTRSACTKHGLPPNRNPRITSDCCFVRGLILSVSLPSPRCELRYFSNCFGILFSGFRCISTIMRCHLPFSKCLCTRRPTSRETW